MITVPLTPPGTVVRLAAGEGTLATTIDLAPPFTADVWAAPAVLGTGAAHRLQGVLLGTPAEDGSQEQPVAWTLGLDRSGYPVVRLDQGGATVTDVRGPSPLPRLTWSRLTVVFTDERLTLGVDGTAVASASLPADVSLPRRQTVTVGESRDTVVDGAVRYGYFTGLISETTVHAGHGPVAGGAEPTTDPREAWVTDPSSYGADRDRPRYHFMPPAHWMNEPHGAVHHGGRHHLFYQRNELGPFWGSITWGHAVSDDLVRWTDLGSPLDGAEIPYSPEGVWSGSATVDRDGAPLVFFTAGDDRDDPNQRTAWARPADPHDPTLRTWVPGPAPVTTLHDALPDLRRRGLEPLPREFRDPFVWRDGDLWFQLVGAGIQGRGGTALLFRSPDPMSEEWEFLGPLMVGDATSRPDTGVHWELPVLVPVGRDADGRLKHAFFITPWWPQPCEHSLLYAWYWVGTWDAGTATWTPDHDDPRLLDVGGFFTGVTASRTPDGRTLLWTVSQDLLSDHEHARRGWAGNAGLPVEIWFRDGDVCVAPVRELASLRESLALDLVEGPSSRLPDTIPVSAGPTAELELTAHVPAGGSVELAVRAPAGEDPAVLVVVTRTGVASGRIEVIRRGSTEPARLHRCGDDLRIDPDGHLRLRAFVDHSMVEVYVQEHRSVTTRAWARDGDDDAGWVRAAGGAALTSLRVWRLHEAVVAEDR